MAGEKLATGIDFLQCLDTDLSMCIMSRIDDPVDLVRASSVSHTWRNFVLANGFAKKLFLKRFPYVSNIVDVQILSFEHLLEDMVENQETEQEILLKDHRVFAALIHTITKPKSQPKGCMKRAISASSTCHPRLGIARTLDVHTYVDGNVRRPSLWLSKGQSNSDVPETLIYKLRDGAWVLTKIGIQPIHQGSFQQRSYVYPPKSVRIRIGHSKYSREIEEAFDQSRFPEPVNDHFVWTYTSPEFPMTQDLYLQLPEPVVCIDGYLQIELLGKVQRKQPDGLFYVGIRFVRVLGHPLYPDFDIKVLETYEKLSLTYEKYPDWFDKLAPLPPQIWDFRWRDIIIEGDCLNIIRQILANEEVCSYLGNIIEECKMFFVHFNRIKIEFVKRDANVVAHVLARNAAHACVGSGDIPDFVLNYVVDDL